MVNIGLRNLWVGQENNDREVAKYLSHDCQIDFNLFLSLLVPKRKKKQSVIALVRYVFSKWPFSKGEEFDGNSEKKDATA